MRAITLQGATNVRDLGGIPVSGGRTVKPGLLFRGGALHALTPEDQDILFGQHGIKTVVDLRISWECEAKPDRIPQDVRFIWLPYYDKDEVGIEYNESAAGTKTQGHDFACNPRHFYQSLANELVVGQMRKAVHTIFEEACAGRPVYEHCSGGKDRAGIMALLLLTILGASEDAILDDYLETNIARDANIQPIYERFLRLCDGDEAFAWEITNAHRALPENLQAFYTAIAEKYGTMEEFICNQLGVTEELRRYWQSCCTE